MTGTCLTRSYCSMKSASVSSTKCTKILSWRPALCRHQMVSILHNTQTCAYCAVHNQVYSIHPNLRVSFAPQTRNYRSRPLIQRPRFQRNPAVKNPTTRQPSRLQNVSSSRPRQKARALGGSYRVRVLKRAHKTRASGHAPLTYAGE